MAFFSSPLYILENFVPLFNTKWAIIFEKTLSPIKMTLIRHTKKANFEILEDCIQSPCFKTESK
jgi:hypothetical protein